jgi:hypothetical protein
MLKIILLFFVKKISQHNSSIFISVPTFSIRQIQRTAKNFANLIVTCNIFMLCNKIISIFIWTSKYKQCGSSKITKTADPFELNKNIFLKLKV